jgi:spermidine synthase
VTLTRGIGLRKGGGGRDTDGVGENLVRRGAAERRAVHQEVGTGLAELVPDLSRTDSWLLFVDGIPQSQVDLGDPGYLEFEYVRRIGHVADLAFPEGQPLRALHMGGGAMTLPRYIAHTRPGSVQLVAELDTELTELVRRHLPLRRPRGAATGRGGGAGSAGSPGSAGGAGGARPGAGRIRVRAGDAREVLESVPAASQDLVISDVFAGARTPFHLTTVECAAAAARALRSGGVYAVNVADGPPLEKVRATVATVRSVFGETCMIAEAGVLRGRRLGNLVIAASDSRLPCVELRRAAAADPFPARVLDSAELIQFASGAPVITDATGPTGIAAQPTNW